MGDIGAVAMGAGMWGLAVLRDLPELDAASIGALCEAAGVLSQVAAEGTAGGAPEEVSVVAGYADYADTYGYANTPLTSTEAPLVDAWLAKLPDGAKVLDAGCGNGRNAARMLPRLKVVGVDLSPHMLVKAAKRLPGGVWREGDLSHLPVEAATMDAALCSLAVGHVADVERVVRELAQAVKRGGQVLMTELHPSAIEIGGQTFVPGEGVRFVRKYAHPVSGYLKAFRRYGLQVVDCHELRYGAEALELFELEEARDAVVAALAGWPAVLAWELERW